jgi:hypothetical protein
MHALTLSFALWVGFAGSDIKAAQEASQQTAQVLLPPTVDALPEDQAWRMIAAEGGGTVLSLVIAVTVIWKKLGANQARQEKLSEQRLEEARLQNRMLVETQANAIIRLSEAMIRVEGAVKQSDSNNTNAIGRLSDTVQAATLRLDKHESKLEAQGTNLMEHSHRLSVLESGTHRILPPVPARGKRRPGEDG